MKRLLLLAAACAALAGCGGDEDTFRREYRKLDPQLAALGRDVTGAMRDAPERSGSELAKEFGALAGRAGRLERKVDDLSPPGQLEADQEELTESLGDAREALAGIERAARASDIPAAQRSRQGLLRAAKGLTGARSRLADATGG